MEGTLCQMMAPESCVAGTLADLAMLFTGKAFEQFGERALRAMAAVNEG